MGANKFKVGDIVWAVLIDRVVLKAKIEKISFSETRNVLYFCRYFDGGVGYVPEEELFRSEMDAGYEVEKRNENKH